MLPVLALCIHVLLARSLLGWGVTTAIGDMGQRRGPDAPDSPAVVRLGLTNKTLGDGAVVPRGGGGGQRGRRAIAAKGPRKVRGQKGVSE